MATELRAYESQEALVKEFQKQWLLNDVPAAALPLAESASLIQLAVGEILINEGQMDNQIYFILQGKVRIMLGEKTLTVRGAGLHVGEVAMIDPSCPRTATIMAAEPSVVAMIEEVDFVQVADRYPNIWRKLGVELARRSLDSMRSILGPSS